MPLRIAFDLDGTLADFETAYRRYAERFSGTDGADGTAVEPEAREAEERKLAAHGEPRARVDPQTPAAPAQSPRVRRRRMDEVWDAIEATANFWTSLRPIEPGVIVRIRELAERHRWEVFFVTQRPATEGETVQRQTQRWLIQQGFDMPSVIVLSGARGKLAAALHLDYLVDDSAKNGVDVISDSKARVLLVVRDSDAATEASARRLGLGVVRSISDALEILEHATEATTQPTMLARLARLVGWRR
jgi:FMN phosphatase YigB (HAD superfamily)